jgi:hypothetical protein
MGFQDRGRALWEENRPQLNSATTFNNLIIVNKRVVVNGRGCTGTWKSKSLFSNAGLAYQVGERS